MKFMSGVVLCGACASLAAAGPAPVFLGDNSTSSSYMHSGGEFTTLGDPIYFNAYGPLGFELYRTDSTTGSIQMVRDIYPGPGSSRPEMLTAFEDKLYFFAYEPIHGTTLWKSDGTALGTVPAVDPAQGVHAYPSSNLATTTNGLFFIATVDGSLRVAMTDGSSSEATVLDDYTVQMIRLISLRDRVYFMANRGSDPMVMWSTDGTEPGTQPALAATTAGTTATITWLAEFNGSIYFQGTDGVNTGLWTVQDFSEPATFLGSITADFDGGFVEYNGAVYFGARVSGGSSNFALWKTDGTQGGTSLVKNLQLDAGRRLKDLSVVGNHLVFRAGIAGLDFDFDAPVWTSDGTGPGTMPLLPSWVQGGASLVVVDGIAYFDKYDAATGRELWQTDGTAAGTTLTVDVAPGVTSSSPEGLTVVGDSVVFASGNPTVSVPCYIYTPSTKGLNAKAESDAPASLIVNSATVIGNRIFYSAGDGKYGIEPWVSDGTPEGTFRLGDLYPGAASSHPLSFTAAGGTVYFLAADGPNGVDLWKTDGTLAGTALVERLAVDREVSMVVAGNEVYINGRVRANVKPGDNPGGTARLWRSNGTAAGTYVVEAVTQNRFLASIGGTAIYMDSTGILKAADPVSSVTTALIDRSRRVQPPTDSWPAYVEHNGSIYFPLSESNGVDYQLWKTNGTAAGTSLVLNQPETVDDMVVGPVINGRIFVTAHNPKQKLWMTDGTPAGSIKLADFEDYTVRPADVAAVGNKFVFRGNGPNGLEPWFTDGTPAGTHLLKDVSLTTTTSGSRPDQFVSGGGYVYFRADDGVAGPELWRTDGTAENTQMVADLNPGAPGSSPTGLVTLGSDLLFSAYVPAHGWELRRITAGAELPEVLDIVPGPEGSGPSGLKVVGNQVIFQAHTPGTGSDLWSLERTATSAVEEWSLY